MKFTANNRFIVEAYKTDKSLRSKVSNGFATIDQKGVLKGLKLLVDAEIIGRQISIGDISAPKVVRAGSTIYLREEVLHNAPWAKTFFEAPGIEGQFIIVDISNVEMIEEAE